VTTTPKCTKDQQLFSRCTWTIFQNFYANYNELYPQTSSQGLSEFEQIAATRARLRDSESWKTDSSVVSDYALTEIKLDPANNPTKPTPKAKAAKKSAVVVTKDDAEKSSPQLKKVGKKSAAIPKKEEETFDASKKADKTGSKQEKTEPETKVAKGGRKPSDPATNEDKKTAQPEKSPAKVKIGKKSAKIPSSSTDKESAKSAKKSKSVNKVEKVALKKEESASNAEKTGKVEKTVKTVRKN